MCFRTARATFLALSLIAFGCAPSAIGCGPAGSDAHVGARARPATPDARDSAATAAAKDAKRAARRAKKLDEARSATGPILEGVRCAAFVPFLPSAFEGYRAKGPAEGKDIDLGEGAGLTVLRRGYFKSSTGLELEIVDTDRAKPLRELFERTREIERNTDVAVIRPLRIQNYEAVGQWNRTAKASRVTVLVEGRFLVNMSLRPTDSIASTVELAEKLDLAGLAKLELGNQVAAH